MNQKSNERRPKRDHPAHPPVVDRLNRATIIFLTVCTKQRRPILANEASHFCLCESWRTSAPWLVGRYMVMPDHIHLFCAPATWPPSPLAGWIRHWRTAYTRSTGSIPGSVWHRDYWDVQLRRHESYTTKWQYVSENPVRAGLAALSDDWPYQGELNVLSWYQY